MPLCGGSVFTAGTRGPGWCEGGRRTRILSARRGRRRPRRSVAKGDRRDSVPRWLRRARRRCVASKRHALQRSEAGRRRALSVAEGRGHRRVRRLFAPRLIQRAAGVRLRRRHYRAPSGDGWWRGKIDPCVVTRGAVLGRGAWIGILGCCSTSFFLGCFFVSFCLRTRVTSVALCSAARSARRIPAALATCGGRARVSFFWGLVA